VKDQIESPFGGRASWRLAYPVRKIVARYELRCGMDVSEYFQDMKSVNLYECERTGYLFWRPECLAGDEAFYRRLASYMPDYYSTERWEYPEARKWLSGASRVLEVGCGQGWFLKSLERKGLAGVGLEYNGEAISGKVTTCPMYKEDVAEFAKCHSGEFDAVCAFQVLEHVVAPRQFIQACVDCLKPGGHLLLSTPNHGRTSLQAFEQAMDLPPHHMGYFTQAIYGRIAKAMDLDFVGCRIEPLRFGFSDTISEKLARSFIFRIVNKCGTILYNTTLAAMKEQGQHILAVFRRRQA
jgi:SAM-dependent methyltransferase